MFNSFEAFMQDTVPKQRQHNEINGGPHAIVHPSLRTDAVIHHLIPVFTCQNLQFRAKHRSDQNHHFRQVNESVSDGIMSPSVVN